MPYASWPKLISKRERTLVTLTRGHLWMLRPEDDVASTTPLTLYRDGEAITRLDIDRGQVADFTVHHDIVAVATVNPAGLYISKTFPNRHVVYLRFPLEPEATPTVDCVTLGNYGADLAVVWHGTGAGPIFIGLISGHDAFRFDYKPLTQYDQKGRPRIYLRKPYEKVIAVPHLPRQFGTVAVLSNFGIKFFSLKPYYTLNPFNDYIMDTPLFFNMSAMDPYTLSFPSRVQFDCWDMMVQINNNHLVLKYDVLDQAQESKKDWIKITLDGQAVQPNDILYLTPTGTDRTMNIEAVEALGDIEIHADLPVSIRRSDQVPDDQLSHLGVKYLPKGLGTDILMRTTQCLTPWQLARFIEKFNIKLRAEVWS